MAWRRDSDPPSPPTPDYSLALAEARRRLDNQLGVIEASRGRASSLLSVGGLLGTFIGGLGAVRQDASMTGALWVAAGAFGVAVLAGLAVLWPRKLHGDMDAETLVEWARNGYPRADQEQTIALAVAKQVKENAGKAGAVQFCLVLAILALAVEFGALGYQLIRST